MTVASFKKAIQFYGEENILSIQFDNYSAQIFSSSMPFKMANYFKEDMEALTFMSSDVTGTPFEVCIPIGEIKMILAKSKDFKHEDFVRDSLRG